MTAVGVGSHRPAPLASKLFGHGVVVERSDRLRRTVEGSVFGRNANVREHARDGPIDGRSQLGGDQRADLRLRLRHREPEWQGRNFVGRALLPNQLVPDLRPVSVSDDDLWAGVGEKRMERRDGAAQIGELLGCGPTLARTHQRVAAERDDRSHTSAVSSIRPFCTRTSFKVGSPISCNL